MRRKDRQISEEESYSILENAEYGILSMVSSEGSPYGIPINFCIIDRKIYIHCATEGQKLEYINSNPQISFCVVGKTEVLQEQFSTKYESVILFGKAEEVFGNDKHLALEGFIHKYSPSCVSDGMKYIEKFIDVTKIFRISISKITGKAKR